MSSLRGCHLSRCLLSRGSLLFSAGGLFTLIEGGLVATSPSFSKVCVRYYTETDGECTTPVSAGGDLPPSVDFNVMSDVGATDGCATIPSDVTIFSGTPHAAALCVEEEDGSGEILCATSHQSDCEMTTDGLRGYLDDPNMQWVFKALDGCQAYSIDVRPGETWEGSWKTTEGPCGDDDVVGDNDDDDVDEDADNDADYSGFVFTTPAFSKICVRHYTERTGQCNTPVGAGASIPPFVEYDAMSDVHAIDGCSSLPSGYYMYNQYINFGAALCREDDLGDTVCARHSGGDCEAITDELRRYLDPAMEFAFWKLGECDMYSEEIGAGENWKGSRKYTEGPCEEDGNGADENDGDDANDAENDADDSGDDTTSRSSMTGGSIQEAAMIFVTIFLLGVSA